MTELRKSPFTMISVEEALNICLRETKQLSPEVVDIRDSFNRIVAEKIVAKDPFPSFRASVMDGYAVFAPIKKGASLQLQQTILAGDSRHHALSFPSTAAYITTGAQVPDEVCVPVTN